MSQLKPTRQQTQSALDELSLQLYDELKQSSLKHWLDDHKVAKKLDQKIQEWAFQAKSSLDQQHPYAMSQQQLEHWLALKHLEQGHFVQFHDEYAAFMQTLGIPEFTEMWQQSQQSLLTEQQRQLQIELFKGKWQRKLTEAIAHWEFEQLRLQRDAFLDEIKDFLATLSKMVKHHDSVGFETGIFLDYSKGQLTEHDVQNFEQWANYLEQDRALKRLCQMIGSAQPNMPRKRISAQLEQEPQQLIHTPMAQEEITGIKLAQELSMALPSELALLADPYLQVLFDLKYLESNLMSFNRQGQQHGRVIEDPRHTQRRVGQKGPMIVCLDTSGSMNGQPELISKAICLYLSIRALKEKRAMYLVNFSTNLTALNLQRNSALDDVIHFLGQSFHGGTDIIPAMNHAVDMLKQPNFVHADVVVISDFIMGQLTEELMQEITHFKQQGNGFYAVAIGNFKLDHLDDSLFDHQWVYQSATGEVQRIQ